MEVYKARVVTSYSPLAPTELICHIIDSSTEKDGEDIQIRYTSPFNSYDAKGGGFTGYPQENDVILIVKPENDEDWYYLSTVVGMEITREGNTVTSDPKGADLFAGDTRMKSVGLKGNAGQNLEFVDVSNDEMKRQGVSLTDGIGGRVSMVKGPNSSVNMEVQGGNTRVKLNQPSNNGSFQPPDSLLSEAKGNATLKSKGGALRLTVGSTGRKINITNWASRFANRAGAFDLDAGDIDILSARNSVNIRAMSFLPQDLPSIYIEANRIIPTSVVQIRAGGNIDLIANAAVPGVGGISLTTTGDIKLNAGGMVYINGLQVHLNNPAGVIPKVPTLSNYEKSLGTAGVG